MIKRDMKSVASVSATQNVLDGLSPTERKRFNKDYPGLLQEFKKIKSNIFARKLPNDPVMGKEPKKSVRNPIKGKEPKTPVRSSPTAPKPNPKRKPLPKNLPKPKPKRKQNSGVKFDTTGTLPGKTIKKN